MRARQQLTLLALTALLGACAAAGPPGVESASTGACGPVESQPDQGHHHLVGDAEPPVAYGSVPPTSGWHHREPDRIHLEVRGDGDALSEPEQVSVLAVGGVVVSYRQLSDADRDRLEGLVVERYPGRVALTPYDRLEPGQVALTAWGLRQLCDGYDRDALAAFVDAHAAERPDFTMGGEHDHDHD